MDKENDLLNFAWDDNEAADFFNDTAEKDSKKETTDVEDTIPEKKEKKKEEVENKVDEKKEDETEKVSDEEFFEDTDTVNSSKSPDNSNSNNYTDTIRKMKDRNILSMDIDPDEEIDEDDFLALQEKEIVTRVNSEIENFANNLTDEGKLFIKYVKEGGNPKEFFDVLKDTTNIPLYLEDNDTENKKVIRYYLKNIKEIDNEDIDDTISQWEEKGVLDNYAKKYSTHLEKLKTKQETSKLNQLEEEKKRNQKNKEEFENKIISFLDETDTIGNIELQDKEKDILKAYLFKPQKKKGSNTYVSQFSVDLQNVFNNPENLIVLAKIMHSGFKLDDIAKNIETKITKETKKKINKHSTSTKTDNKSLADFFNI